MENSRGTMLQHVLACLTVALIVKVTASVVVGYRDYFPPDFGSEFLWGREGYFWGAYHYAFYTHLVSGPLSLIVGLVLISNQFRVRFPKWHRSLGKLQAGIVLLLLAPSGLWMARYAEAGFIAAVGLSVLAVVTGTCVVCGWRAAVKRQFAEHRRWMMRCFLLLCSAVVVRLMGGFLVVAGFEAEWIYPLIPWASWLAPLVVYEIGGARVRRFRRTAFEDQSPVSAGALSLPAMVISARRVSAGISAGRK